MRHVVALSGGKDSTAMALRLAEIEPRDYLYVITPTGNEFPSMLAHWKRIADLLGRPLTIATTGRSLHGLIRKQQMLPNHTARWCTRMLKLEPYYAWLAQHTPCVSYVGLRADEQDRAGMVFPEASGVTLRCPMQEWGWTIADVQAYLKQRQIEVPTRTDCKDCFWQKLGEWYEYWRDDPEAFEQAAQLEEEISASRGRTYTFRSPQRDAWPASLRDLGAKFAAGEIPTRSLNGINRLRESGSCRVCTL